MNKVRMAGAVVGTAALAAVLLPFPTASASQVGCDDDNFVKVSYHYNVGEFGGGTDVACFANAGRNWFAGHDSYTSWMYHLHTGNNDITYVDCNGTYVDYPRGTDTDFGGVDRCISALNIKPY